MNKYEIELDQLLIDSFANCSTIDEIYECESYQVIHQAILKAKAFDVIKNKRVDAGSEIIETPNYEEYHNLYVVHLIEDKYILNEEEYNLIKQALEVE